MPVPVDPIRVLPTSNDDAQWKRDVLRFSNDVAAALTEAESRLQTSEAVQGRSGGTTGQIDAAAAPMFQVFKNAGAFTMPSAWTLADAAWGTPHINNGFTSWSSGVLTISQAGIYRISFKLMVVGNGTLGAQIVRNHTTFDTVNTISNMQLQSDFSANRTISDSFMYTCAGTDTLRVFWIDTGSGTSATLPQHAQFGVEFIR